MPSPLIQASRRLTLALQETPLPPKESGASHLYRPLEYARHPHELFLEQYGSGEKNVLFLGMNPGPYGMAQTGIPFGEISAVRDWMHITAPVSKPQEEHPKRPILGFECPRSEVSGQRLWSLFQQEFGSAHTFFRTHFVINFCPLLWLKTTGANITPDKFTKAYMEPINHACLQHLREALLILNPQVLVGIGHYAEKKLIEASQFDSSSKKQYQIGRILHPSPASPAANRGFFTSAREQLKALGIL